MGVREFDGGSGKGSGCFCDRKAFMMDWTERDVLLRIVSRFSKARVLLLGDFVADEFVDGEISRVSREAPVLILKHRRTSIVPGGGANAANNLVDLGARVFPLSIVGSDSQGKLLREIFRAKGVSTDGILVDRKFSTTTKSRILAGSAHTMHQQVVRIDRESITPPSSAMIGKLLAKARQRVRGVEAVLISDYGSGLITPERVDQMRSSALRTRIPATIDSRYQLSAFQGFTAATPNEPELEAALGVRIGNDLKALESAGRRMLRRLRVQALLVTRGKEGMALFEPGKKTVHVPIFGTDQIADVTGAGDTVIAVFTLALASGASFSQAARLSNYAGGLVVMKHGTATIRRQELVAAIESDTVSST
jgi:rfaE bifunctional protein kinase chain/domain